MSRDLLCDIDGTLADLTHRRHYIAQRPKNYEAFHAAADRDTVIKPVAEIVISLHRDGWRVILCSGRPESSREMTRRWMLDNFIPFDRLYMRPNNDFRADDLIKSELLDRILADGFNPMLVIDDRMRVLRMWQARGLMVLAVNCGAEF